jgi:shikimate 5-dehydrogenase
LIVIVVGRYSESDSRPLLRINSFYSNQIIVDLFYLQAKSRLLMEATEEDFRAINGAKMLGWPGAEAFSLWT